MKILVTGGAGYIGSQMVRQLFEKNHKVVVLDNLKEGHRKTLPSTIPLITGDVNDQNCLFKLFSENRFDAVMHFAGVISMKESMQNPYKYFYTNTYGALNLIEAMVKSGVLRLIFSSSAGVYGNPTRIPISENDPQEPTNPYGESKLMVEKILAWYDQLFNLRSVSLRYFNAAGASLDGQFGEDHQEETHLIPLAVKAALENREFTIYGNDYETKDGTCIRDYIHVIDLCEAHLLALDSLMKNSSSHIYNVGPGIGFSNIEVVNIVKKVSGVDFPLKFGSRRPGDAKELIADAAKIKKELGWEPKYSDLQTIVETAWKWHSTHPKGYGPDKRR
ncbi:MAG: UDP-glucose 4-epimerase GalE [Patescibacteria group bacterium]|nr:UDP-glucose 4-epimerase GalE [Patescibacteria group bacterium]MCL5095145.1 UDP-glucose 4-epimerase GalE [Patescibacteria group bacterium]